MKLTKKIIAALLLLTVAMPMTFDLDAQTRKRTTTHKTATTKKSTNRKATAGRVALTAAKLNGNSYIGIFDLSSLNNMKEAGVFSTFSFTSDEISLELGAFGKLTDGYTIKGNKVVCNRIGVSMSSNNGGKTFTCVCSNNRTTMSGTFFKANETDCTETGEKLLDKLCNNEYIPFIILKNLRNEQASVTFTNFQISFKKGEENKWKLIYDIPLLMSVGGLKGTFTIDGSDIKITDSEGSEGTGRIFGNGDYGYFGIGERVIDGTKFNLKVIFVKK